MKPEPAGVSCRIQDYGKRRNEPQHTEEQLCARRKEAETQNTAVPCGRGKDERFQDRRGGAEVLLQGSHTKLLENAEFLITKPSKL